MSNDSPIVKLVSDEEAQGKTKELFEGMKAQKGQVPKWMRVMANCDDVLHGFFAMFKATMDDTPLPSILKWKIALKVSDLNKCDYCVSVAQYQLKEFGITQDQIKTLENDLDEKEKLALEYSIHATQNAYNINPELISKVKEVFTDEEIVELTAVVGLFSFINRFNDALGILPDTQ